MNVIGYARLSAGSEESTSLARQRELITRHAEARGWKLLRIVEDPIASASKLRLNRPGITEVRRALRDGEADAVIVWRLDRLARSVVDFGTLLDEGIAVVSATEPLDTTTSMGRAMAEILQVFAAMEARAISERVTNSVDYLRRNDRFAGGVVPFGYRSAAATGGPGRVLKIDPREANIVREIARRALDGESMVKITASLNERGVPTTRSAARKATQLGASIDGLKSGTWTTSIVRELLVGETLLGRVMTRGQVVRDEAGLPRQVWDPILDLDTVTRLRERYSGTRQVQKRPRAARLLSGVAYCAHCDRKLYVRKSGSHPYYRCSAASNGQLCPAPTIDAQNLDDYVTKRFLAVAGDWPEVDEVETVADLETIAALAETEAAIRETTAALALDDADTAALVARLQDLKSARAELRETPSTVITELVPTGRTLREAWLADDDVHSRRRTLLRALDHVTVSRRLKRGKSFEDERVDIRWNS